MNAVTTEERNITFDIAKAAKALGFEVYERGWYNRFGSKLGRTDVDEHGNTYYYGSGAYNKPTDIKVSKEFYEQWILVKYPCCPQSTLIKWLRTEHDLDVDIHRHENQFREFVHKQHGTKLPKYHYKLSYGGDGIPNIGKSMDDYEDLAEDALSEALKFLHGKLTA